MTFRLYSDSGGPPTLLWTEIHDVAVGNADAVTVTDGVFSVTLGAVTPLNLADFDNPVWLGITVGTDPEMTPLAVGRRRRLCPAGQGRRDGGLLR